MFNNGIITMNSGHIRSNSVMAASQQIEDIDVKLFQNDQGPHECNVTSECQAVHLNQFNDCEKNLGHKEYIPITELTPDHLGSHCNREHIFNIIKTEAELTVYVRVKYVSKSRPDNYPFCHYRGTNSTRTGTGWVRWARDKFTEKDNKPCPCPECKCSPFPKKEWGRVYVRTAQHVVFDTSEAEHTQCILFYDRPEDYGKVPSLQGLAVTLNIQADDWSELSCITHDLSLWNKLDELDHLRDDLFEKEKRQYLNNKNSSKDQMTIVISHPHGCSKQVSIGRWTHQQKVGQYDYTRYFYTACTCRGSSGAPVYLLGADRFCMMCSHPHSKRGDDDGINVSGVGWN